MKLISLKEFNNLLVVSIGSAAVAAGVAFFLLPANIATGGTPGMGLLVHYLSGISTGIAMLLINIPLLIAGIKFVDAKFALRSVYSMLLISILVDIFTQYFEFPELDSLLLSTLYGGTIIGAGVGLVLKGNASAGGTTIIARIVSNFSHIKPAQVVLSIDVIIVVAIGFIFSDVEKALWSMLSIYATTQLIDKILTGAAKEKIVHIVSKNNHIIGSVIATHFKREGTLLNGTNLTNEYDKSILFVMIGARMLPELKNLILSVDSEARMIVMEAAEIVGSNKKLS